MKIEQIKISDLKPYVKNAKIHDKDQIEKLAKSIKSFGFKQPLVVDVNNVIIAGHGRLEAAKLVGLKELPCIVADDLNEAESKAYRLTDNKLNESEWEVNLLIEELKELQGLSYNLNLLGFNDNELKWHLTEGEAIEDLNKEWQGMPEYNNEDKTSFKQIHVHFKSEKEMKEFSILIGQKVTLKVKSLWYPKNEIETYADKEYS